MARRLLIAQGTDLLVRGYGSVPPDRVTPDGSPASGLYAVARVIQAGLAFKLPDTAIVVLAGNADPEWDERLKTQSDGLSSLFVSHGFVPVVSDQPTALVASYVQAGLDQGWDAVVLGSDKRFAQLVGPRVWWYDGYKRVRYTPTSVKKRFLVAPEHVADWLAMVGDDGVMEGVKGIGGKGAAQLIQDVGPLTAALDDVDNIAGRAGKSLRAHLEQAQAQLKLAHLDQTLTPPVSLGDASYAAPSVAEANATYAALGFFSLLQADNELLSCQVLDDTTALSDAGEAAIHTLSNGPSPARGDWVGLAVVSAAGRFFFPSPGPLVSAWLEDPDQPKLGHHTKAAAVALARIGITLRGVVGDSVVASHLTDPSGSAPHELDQLSAARLHRPLVEPETQLGKGKTARQWSAIAPEKAGAWACQRAEASAALWHQLSPDLDPALVAEYLALSQTLVRMELVGAPCDTDELARAGSDFVEMSEDLAAEIFELAGHEFNLRSTQQLGEVLYSELGLTIHARTRTGWSTATHVLERLVHDHAIVPLVIRYRGLERLRSNWVVSLQNAISPDGRVHSTFHPARSFSGRLVNSEPDLGRVPGATPEMARIRAAFRAPPGTTLLSVDYDQLGLYVLAHLTGDPALVEPLLAGADMHVATASAVLDKPADTITVEERQVGKVVNFATFAGQGASALRRQLGVSVDEARGMIDRFHQRYATVAAFQDDALKQAQEQGFITTITGRRWPIRDVHSKDAQMRGYGQRLARRAPHEASVADVTRRALLRCDQALQTTGSGAKPLLQIHDEVLFEVPEAELQATVALMTKAFATAFELVVPLKVSCKAGPDWAGMKPL